MNALLLFVHIVSAAVWVGGMAFAHFCLRPAAFECLSPPQRVPLLLGALGRFFRLVTAAVILLWFSGLSLMAAVAAAVPPGWLAMAAIAAVMTGVFAWIALRLYPRARQAAQAQHWPDAAAALGDIRGLVLFNLGLGVATIAVATLHR